MINKQNLWFVLLFSVILVLSIFYISMNESDITSFTKIPQTDDTTLVVNESTELVALRVQSDEEDLEIMNELQNILLSETASSLEKNDAFNSLLELSSNKGMEQEIEKMIKNDFSLESFVKINGNNVTIVIISKEHDFTLANKLIRAAQTKFKEYKYITVKFN